jgi:hypothetical protein
MTTSAPVADKRPPERFVKSVNPLVRALLTGPLARVMPSSLVVLRFNGRKSGREYRIVVGWHDVGGGRKAVFSPARWRSNFRDGAPVTVAHSGGTENGTGTLVDDPEAVAPALQHAIDSGSTPRALGLHVDPGHQITPDDVRASGRAMVRLDLG